MEIRGNNCEYFDKRFEKKKKELIGLKIGKVEILDLERKRPFKDGATYIFANCRCECGQEGEVRVNQHFLDREGDYCVCQKCRNRYSHKESTSKEYSVLSDMKTRCYKETNKYYPNYGGRGIKICDRWLEPTTGILNFIEDMGRIPENKDGIRWSIDRIDVDGDYTPENCRWSTDKEQSRNKRGTLYQEYKGVTKPLKDWCEELGVSYQKVRLRMRRSQLTFEESIQDHLVRPKFKQERPVEIENTDTGEILKFESKREAMNAGFNIRKELINTGYLYKGRYLIRIFPSEKDLDRVKKGIKPFYLKGYFE